MGRGYSDGHNDLLILGALELLQGVLLLHPPSKALFSREQNMNVRPSLPFSRPINPILGLPALALLADKLVTFQLLLDLLEPVNCPAIQLATVIVLVTTFIDMPQNTRTFEALDGLLAVTSLFKSRSTTREVKVKVVELLYFYLMPEVPSIPKAGARSSVPAMLQRSPSKLAGAFGGALGNKKHSAEYENTLTTEEKQELLGRHLNSVEDLVKDLRTCSLFGGALS